MANTTAFAISTPTSSLLHSSSSYKASLSVSSNSAVSVPKNAIFQHVRGIPQLGFPPFSHWNGLKRLGISISQCSVKMAREGKCKSKGVYASLFGVGAPEALVIGVVALLVFGPKGLAEVARNFGKTLRSFQPTIRELQEVSREFKSTLEREIGLDEINYPMKSNIPRPPTSYDTPTDSETNVKPSDSPKDSSSSDENGGAYSADEYLQVTEAQLKGALAQLRKEQEEEKQKATESKPESQTPSENPEITSAPQEAASEVPPRPDTEI